MFLRRTRLVVIDGETINRGGPRSSMEPQALEEAEIQLLEAMALSLSVTPPAPVPARVTPRIRPPPQMPSAPAESLADPADVAQPIPQVIPPPAEARPAPPDVPPTPKRPPPMRQPSPVRHPRPTFPPLGRLWNTSPLAYRPVITPLYFHAMALSAQKLSGTSQPLPMVMGPSGDRPESRRLKKRSPIPTPTTVVMIRQTFPWRPPIAINIGEPNE